MIINLVKNSGNVNRNIPPFPAQLLQYCIEPLSHLKTGGARELPYV